MDWIQVAEGLRVGTSTRIVCPECQTDKSAVVSNGPVFYSGKCFRCTWQPFHNKGYQTLAQLAKIEELNRAALEEQSLELPTDINYDHTTWPHEALIWLYKGGVYGDRITAARLSGGR